MRSVPFLSLMLHLVLYTVAIAAPDDGLVAHWDFDEGSGEVLHDRTGHGNDGAVTGASWVRCGDGFALSFDGEDDYVDCGDDPGLNIAGPVTLQAWVRPTAVNRGEPGIAGKFFESYALTYYGNAYWYISSGGNNASGPIQIGAWAHVAGVFDGTMLRMYVNGEETQSRTSKFEEVRPGGRFFIGCVVGDSSNVDPLLRNTAFFPGLIDSVRVHDRALSREEILHYYNLDAAEKGREAFDMTKVGRLLLEPFYYPAEQRAVLSVDWRWGLPLPEGAAIKARLGVPGGDEALIQQQIDLQTGRPEREVEFDLSGLSPGAYELRAVLRTNTASEKWEHVPFDYPFAPLPPVPSPQEISVPALPPPVEPPPYSVEVHAGGGFSVTVGTQTYQIESSYSYPHGGENRLTTGQAGEGDGAWTVEPGQAGANEYHVTAKGTYYTIERRLEQGPSRVLVRDTITNISDDIVGIIFDNYVNTEGLSEAAVTMMANPTVFVGAAENGVGLIALDDLYHLQQRTRHSGGMAGIVDEHFGLDTGASYTIEWAVYPTATNDYFDFISQVRRDEQINRRIDGAFAFVDRRTAPSQELVDRKNLQYTSIGCLGRPPDDPTVSLEGYEFVHYPWECAELKKTFAATKEMHPGVRVMFHVAHGLYATDRPDELFPDSRAVDEHGNQVHYGPNTEEYYGRYFSKERVAGGWRWWLFYPTMENSFGKAMIEGTQYMLDELGATGMWADGFISGYVRGGYTYDRWDGHSVTIDPDTKLVTRKKTCVPYAALPVLKQVARMISDKGGILITNGHPGPPSFWREDVLTSNETGGGDQRPIGGLHLGRSVTPLGNPEAIKNGRDVYRDVLTKLELGALYFWYGDGDRLDRKTLVEHMYPITIESIHAGVVRGRERIVTKRSGVYGWPGDRALHEVHFYDARGTLARHAFVTTVDAQSVRTKVDLDDDESAVVAKLPVTIGTETPLNIRVDAYDENGLRMSLNGRGPIRLRLADGPFRIESGASYEAQVNGRSRPVPAEAGGLALTLDLDGETELVIGKR